MPTFTKHAFSGSSNGQPVNVAGTSSPGTTIHTVGATATGNEFDSVYLFVSNNLTVAQLVTVEFGSTASNANVSLNVDSRAGAQLVIPGWPLFATDSIVRAFAATATAGITIGGYVNRATATA